MKKAQIFALLGFLILLLAVFLVWYCNRPVPAEGSKTVTLEVIHGDGTTASFTIHTDAENLRAALEQVEGLIGGEESTYGLMVYTVDVETADWARDQSWWCLTKGGVWMDTGVDDTMIVDGDVYEFTYTVG
ncbi:MAG: hypothetical protein IKS55_13970 [Oscillospiraceae bacterium]|nr:hypothetical protein [Oscillospiraceae bacterium]